MKRPREYPMQRDAQEAAGQQERCHVTGVQGWIDSSLWQRSLCHVLYKPVSPTSSSWTPRADAYQQIHTRHAPTSHTGCSQEHTDTEVLCYFSRGVCVTVIKKPLTPRHGLASSYQRLPLAIERIIERVRPVTVGVHDLGDQIRHRRALDHSRE